MEIKNKRFTIIFHKEKLSRHTKRNIIICFLAMILLVVSVFIISQQKVSKKIINTYNPQNVETIVVNLSDFTDFKWDSVIIYEWPVTNKDFKQYADFEYNKSLDLQSGMIFIRNNKIVYEEIFDSNFEEQDKFKILPYSDIKNKVKVRKFNKKQAIFTGKITEYKNEKRYLLKPIQEESMNDQ